MHQFSGFRITRTKRIGLRRQGLALVIAISLMAFLFNFSTRFRVENFQPGATVDFAFDGSREAVDKKDDSGRDSNESNTLLQTWPQVGSLAFPLNSKDAEGNVIRLGGLPIASESGPVSIEEMEESLSDSEKRIAGHCQWGLLREDRAILDMTVLQNAHMTVSIDHEEFGMLKSPGLEIT